MTDLLDTAIIQAGLDLLRADPGVNLQDGKVEDDTLPPYVLAYSWISRPEEADSNALDGLSRTIWGRWYLHCVGDTRESASAMAQRARTQMLDQQLSLPSHPTVAFTLIKEESAQQPTPPDESTGGSIFDAIVVYKVRVTI